MIPHVAILLASMALHAVAGTGAAQAGEVGVFTFAGFADAPTQIGERLVLRTVLYHEPSGVPDALPLDYMTLQHTLVIEGDLVSSSSVPYLEQEYQNASVALYSDAIAGGTAANYTAPSSFTDGECILFGTLVHLRRLGSSIGGYQAWTGGSRRNELPSQAPVDTSAFLDWTNPEVPDGYDEAWRGQLLPSLAIEPVTWSAAKVLFR